MAGGITHIVGAGLAGLSTALRLASAGHALRIWEASGHAGGRCRSFEDAKLGRRIDNGNHLVLTGNRSVRAYLDLAGAADALIPAAEAAFPFVDLAMGERWTVRMNAGPVPWWVAMPSRRVAGTKLTDYLEGARLASARPGDTLGDVIRGRGPLWTRFWEPMSLAVLNTAPERGQAQLLWRVFQETFARGASACRPMTAPQGLGTALVDPALTRLATLGHEPTLFAPLGRIEEADGRATALHFKDRDPVVLEPGDKVVLALPPARLGAVMPGLDLPNDTHAILNAHFVVEAAAVLKDAPKILGTIGSKTHWIFTRGDVISLTVSAAEELGHLGGDRDALLAELWDETRKALNLGEISFQAGRILTERRATFDQSPSGVAKRPEAMTRLRNVVLAGDVTRTGLPATIEGAIRSGETAARLIDDMARG